MKNILIAFSIFCLIGCKKDIPIEGDLIHNGDIIFQTSISSQSKAIQLATHSKYSHCGIIYKINESWFVYEAIQPVQTTPLKEWIARGKNNEYVIKRLKNTSLLTPDVLNKMKKSGEEFNRKDYDIYFEWNNDRIYCSELVWKIYKEGANIEIGKLQHLKDFDLSHPVVKQKMTERYGNKLPLNEKVISPSSIYDSDLLYTVLKN
jgi:hypothetical protein